MAKAHAPVLAGLFLACLFVNPILAAPDSKSAPPGAVTSPVGGSDAGDGAGHAMPEIPGMPGDETPPGGETATPLPPDERAGSGDETLPVVEYDFSKLPAPVRRIREQIIEAAATGDPEKLRPIIEANGEPPQFSLNDTGDDPIAFLKSESGDEGGREILAILLDVLDAGYVHVDVGTPDEMYVWPYFAEYPIDKLSPRQLVELFKLVYAGDYEDMKEAGGYNFYQVGIAPNGVWESFMAGIDCSRSRLH